jgi:hypothetical protein
LEIYVKLYAETLHPTYMRNIGRCYQSMGEPDKAIQAFREYLRKAPGLDTKQRAEVDRFIAEMEELKGQRLEAPRSPPSPGVLPAPGPTPPVFVSPDNATAPAALDALTGKRNLRRTAGYVVGAAGLATGAAALLHLLWNKGRNDKFQDEMSMDAELASSIHNQSVVTVTLGVASAALLATGIALVATAPPSPTGAPGVIAPAAGTHAVLLAPRSIAWRVTW